MKIELHRKIVPLEALQALADGHRSAARRVVLCHGCFDIVHPGHVRYLQAAGQHGDILVVSLTGDDAIEKSDGTRPYIPQQYRAENLAALEFVDHVVIADGPTAEPVIDALRPDLYVKGSEYEHSDHPGLARERARVEAGGGRVLFSSGGVTFSSTTLLENLQRAERSGQRSDTAGLDMDDRLAASCERWGLNTQFVAQTLIRMRGQRVLVIGDALCDRYSFCESARCADEAPVLSVSPSHASVYPGAAAVLAAHVQKLGGQATLISAGGNDATTQEMDQTLKNLGVTPVWLRVRESLPSKQRYVADGQKLLKVNHGVPQPLDSAGEAALLAAADATAAAGDGLDAVILADFGYGTLSPRTVGPLIERLGPNGHRVPLIAGDVSGPRRSLKAMRGCQLLTPTEHELRSIAGDFDGSLPSVAAAVMQELNVPCLLTTMGKRGMVLFYPRDPDPAHWFDHRLRSEHLPSLAGHAVDVVGAGDALLAATVLARGAGATEPQAAYLGALAASIVVERVGNLPVSAVELATAAARRPELRPPAPTMRLAAGISVPQPLRSHPA